MAEQDDIAAMAQRFFDAIEAGEDFPEGGDEAARCRAVWARKFGRLPVDAAERGRQMRFLQYRGFSGDAIRRVMRGVDQ